MAQRFSNGAEGPRLKPSLTRETRRAAEMTAFLQRLRVAHGRATINRHRDLMAALDCARLGFVRIPSGGAEARLTGLGQSVLDQLQRGI